MSAPAPGGRPPRAEDALAIIKALSPGERERLFDRLERLPLLYKGTGFVILPERITELLLTALQSSLGMLGDSSGAVRELRRKLAGRNRQSDPETVRRNLEICELRKENPKRWSQGKLARKYGVSTRAIRKILSEEQKWRHLAAGGGPTSRSPGTD